MRIDQLSPIWSGSLRIGLTTMAVSDTTSPAQIPVTADKIMSKVTWIVSGSAVKKNGAVIRENYAPNLERLQVNFSYQKNLLRRMIDLPEMRFAKSWLVSQEWEIMVKK